MSHAPKRRITTGSTSQVRMPTISALISRVLSGSGQSSITGPSRARMIVMTTYAAPQVRSAIL